MYGTKTRYEILTHFTYSQPLFVSIGDVGLPLVPGF